MDDFEKDMIWTALWFLFITGLCVIFRNGFPCWLLVLWVLGLRG